MKLIHAILHNDDSAVVSSALTQAGFSATELPSAGGFLRARNATLMIATEDDKVDQVIEIIGNHSKRRTQFVPSTAAYGMGYQTMPAQVSVGGATVFVTNIERFEKI